MVTAAAGTMVSTACLRNNETFCGGHCVCFVRSAAEECVAECLSPHLGGSACEEIDGMVWSTVGCFALGFLLVTVSVMHAFLWSSDEPEGLAEPIAPVADIGSVPIFDANEGYVEYGANVDLSPKRLKEPQAKIEKP